jgi:adenine-specific DNA-methyltransferase
LVGLEDVVCEVHRRTVDTLHAGIITDAYAPRDDADIQHGERVFYTKRNAMYLDTARTLIAQQPHDIQVFLLAPLIALASVHANTSGVFKGFYKSEQGVGQFGGRGRDALSRIVADITLQAPIFSNYSCDVQVFREDANVWVKDAAHSCDVAYLDPPYNQHPYGSNYFMLNMLAEYVPPQHVSRVSGIPTTWNRSRYNQKGQAEEALFEVIEGLNASHIILSYNAEGFITQERFVERLSRIGAVQTVDIPYPTFRGSRNLRARSKQVVESLYVVEKK